MLAQSQKRMRIINALSTAYAAIMLVNLREHTVEVLKTSKGPQQNYKKAMSSRTQWDQIEKLAAEPYKKGVMDFCEMSTVAQRLKDHEFLTYTWQMANGGVQGAHTGVIGSPVHVRQVLQNVASNAIKYTPEGGSVTLECCETLCTDGQVTYNFRCTDTGIGMSPEFQQRAFEPYAQENANARTAYSGTGLGLAITKELVEQMGGLEATRRIRALPRSDAAAIPIFAMTANAFQDDIERSRAAGMNEHLTKPLDAPQLMETIARYCR